MSLKINHALNCPNCQSSMTPIVLGCETCSLEIRGHFSANPFSQLSEDMLHFLNVFIHCEGKISDMEKALGISYPTVKLKLSKLKESIQPKAEIKPAKELSTLEILSKMEKGEMDYETGLKLIKSIQEKKK